VRGGVRREVIGALSMSLSGAARQAHHRMGLATRLDRIESALREPRHNPLFRRACVAAGIAANAGFGVHPADVAEERWGRNAGLYTKAATSPDTTVVTGASLVATATADFLPMMPTCAFGQASSHCVQL
jgi:hypothetical protein